MQGRSALSERMLDEWTDAFFEALDRGPCEPIRRARVGRLQGLNRLSDEDLRALGLSRELIPAHVFADLYVDRSLFG